MKKYPKTVELTRKNFFDAFWKLYTMDNSNKITISNICKAADYDRTTFYRYFNDLDDILCQFEDDLINNLKSDIRNKGREFSQISADRFKYFTEKYGKYIIVFYEKGNRRFYEKFKELVINEVYDLLKFKVKGESNKNFLYEFLFSLIIISYAYWYKHPEVMSFEDFVRLLDNVLLNASKTIISKLNS